MQPMTMGADFVIHSATKFLSGHGDVLGGIVVAQEEHRAILQALTRTLGPNLGPFEAYLAMRGIKTLPLRMERQCRNACRVAAWLNGHPRVEKVYFPGDPRHPDAAAIKRLLPDGLYGAVVSFEIKDAKEPDIFRFIGRLAARRGGHDAGRRAYAGALPGYEFPSRLGAEAAGTIGYSRESATAFGRHRGSGRHRGRPRPRARGLGNPSQTHNASPR